MYKIGEVARRTGISVHTLRYYEKEGLLNFVERTKSGIRLFSESDLEWLAMISCLKGTGMSIKDIQGFMACCKEGDATLARRLELFVEHKKQLEAKMEAMRGHMERIEYKIRYYTIAVAAGTEAVHKTGAASCTGEQP